jgi:hypothetical protein
MPNKSADFIPRDDFSKSILKSIPNKVTSWLLNLGMLKKQKGSAGNLTWRIRNNDGKSFLRIGDTLVEWLGGFGDVYYVSINQSWVGDIANNMDKFIALEKSIYDEIQKLEDAFYDDDQIEIPLQGVDNHDRVLPTLQTS